MEQGDSRAQKRTFRANLGAETEKVLQMPPYSEQPESLPRSKTLHILSKTLLTLKSEEESILLNVF